LVLLRSSWDSFVGAAMLWLPMLLLLQLLSLLLLLLELALLGLPLVVLVVLVVLLQAPRVLLMRCSSTMV
jgi:hypothetical protein